MSYYLPMQIPGHIKKKKTQEIIIDWKINIL